MRAGWVILLLIMAHSLSAQVVTVRNRENGHPLEFVTIISKDHSHTAFTNSDGQAPISLFVHSDLIEFRLVGYTYQSYSFNELEKLNFEVNLSPSMFYLDQVIVSASKWSQASREVPLKVASITESQVNIHNPQTAADLLGLSGQVFIQKSQQGGGSPMIRGFAANRLLIAVDGVRMNNAIFRSGNLQNVISLDPFAIEQTEVVFGSGSVIYGSDAIGGVMSFYTRSPKHSTENKPTVSGNFSSRFASANIEKTGHLHINAGGKAWATITSLSYTNYGNLKMGSHGPDEYLRYEYVIRRKNEDILVPNSNPKVQFPSAYAQTNLMQKISFRPNGYWDITYGFHHSETNDLDRYDRLIYFHNNEPRSGEWYYGPQVWLMNNIRFRNFNKSRAYDQFTLIAAHQYFRESRHDRTFNDNILRNRTEKVNAFSLNLDMKKSVGEQQVLFYGVETIINDVNSSSFDRNITSRTEIPGVPRYPKAIWASYAAYLTLQHKLSNKVNLQAGGRYNHYLLGADFDTTLIFLPFQSTKISQGALTASMGLTMSPSEKWRIHANASTGFRAPNVDDIGKVFDSEPGAVVIPNLNLKAEYAFNAELGFTKVCGDYFEIDFFPFFTLLKDAMVRREDTFSGQDSILYDGIMSQVLSIQNVAYAKVWGFQADFELKLPGNLEWSSKFNFQKGVEELENGEISNLRHAGPWFGTSQLVYSARKIKTYIYINFSGEVAYKNLAKEEKGKPYLYAIDSYGNPYSPSWYTLNLKFQFQVNQKVKISGGVENITDQRYRPYSSGFTAPGINLIGAVSINF